MGIESVAFDFVDVYVDHFEVFVLLFIKYFQFAFLF